MGRSPDAACVSPPGVTQPLSPNSGTGHTARAPGRPARSQQPLSRCARVPVSEPLAAGSPLPRAHGPAPCRLLQGLGARCGPPGLALFLPSLWWTLFLACSCQSC